MTVLKYFPKRVEERINLIVKVDKIIQPLRLDFLINYDKSFFARYLKSSFYSIHIPAGVFAQSSIDYPTYDYTPHTLSHEHSASLSPFRMYSSVVID
jgi:hypothetical protein